jgi:hypothetical protein
VVIPMSGTVRTHLFGCIDVVARCSPGGKNIVRNGFVLATDVAI